MKNSLYAYFGLLDLHTIDSPGHSFYQIGLIDSLRVTFNEDKFDFYSYYPKNVIDDNYSSNVINYPNSELGRLFLEYYNDMIENYCVSISNVILNIKEKKYNRLYLKARFRNLSTLSKKWKDARDFEEMIDAAISSGYSKNDIVILDTDLSLPESFYLKYSKSVTISVPSIDFPGISHRFLQSCFSINCNNYYDRKSNIVFYGNIDTSNYKSGNSKSEELLNFLKQIGTFYDEASQSSFYIISKGQSYDLPYSHSFIPRNDRERIWNALETSSIMVNITKEKYNTLKFIPARIYESMIFGLSPISYKFDFLNKTFSFDSEDDLLEILKYFNECTSSDLKNAYRHFIESYLAYASSAY